MFGGGPATRIYLAAGATDMRKGFEGLHGLVGERLREEVRSVLGGQIADRLGPRFGLTDEETESAAWLVR